MLIPHQQLRVTSGLGSDRWCQQRKVDQVPGWRWNCAPIHQQMFPKGCCRYFPHYLSTPISLVNPFWGCLDSGHKRLSCPTGVCFFCGVVVCFVLNGVYIISCHHPHRFNEVIGTKSGMGSLGWCVGVWHPPLKTLVDVLPWTCQSEGKRPSR